MGGREWRRGYGLAARIMGKPKGGITNLNTGEEKKKESPPTEV